MSEDQEGAKGSKPHRTIRWRIDGKTTRQERGPHIDLNVERQMMSGLPVRH
jgi:hypothetical protein